MRIIPKFQNSGKIPTKEQVEYNKKRQQFLNMNGYNIKVDGSWGPWQQQQYDKLTTVDNHYHTTPLGVLSYLYDKYIGDGTTHHEKPYAVTGGTLKKDTRSKARAWVDKQMKDDTSLLGYTAQTVAPVVGTTAAITYGGPYIAGMGRLLVSRRQHFFRNLAAEASTAYIGDVAVDEVSKAATGKTWAENVAQSTGASTGLSKLTSPGVVLGPSAYHTSKNLYIKGPKYIFDNLPYKTMDNVQRSISNIKDDAIIFLKTPLDENPVKAIKAKHKQLQAGRTPRTDIHYEDNVYYNPHNTSVQNIGDPIPQIRARLHTRMNNKDYLYSYPNDGTVIYLDKNLDNPDYIISQIPVKDYLSLKDVYKLGIDKHSRLRDKVINAIQTPINYLKLNTEPAFAYTGDKRFIKVNKKALKDFGLDYSTTLSHEYNHALRNRSLNDGSLQRHLGFNYTHLAPKYKNYLSQSTEIEARGTQLKNYFNSDIITPDMLKYASQHYVPDTNIDNNMYQFFSGIKDWDIAADYLSKYSLKNGGKFTK